MPIKFTLIVTNVLMHVCSIDATCEPKVGRRLGRLVNHSRKVTARPRVLTYNNEPHLCLFAVRDLQRGEQLLYNYGTKLPFHDLVGLLLIMFTVDE